MCSLPHKNRCGPYEFATAIDALLAIREDKLWQHRTALGMGSKNQTRAADDVFCDIVSGENVSVVRVICRDCIAEGWPDGIWERAEPVLQLTIELLANCLKRCNRMLLWSCTGGSITCVLRRRAGMEILLVRFYIESTVHTVEKLSDGAHCEENKVAISAIFRNSRKGQSLDEEFNATGREMKLCEIVTGSRWLVECRIVPGSIPTIRE